MPGPNQPKRSPWDLPLELLKAQTFDPRNRTMAEIEDRGGNTPNLRFNPQPPPPAAPRTLGPPQAPVSPVLPNGQGGLDELLASRGLGQPGDRTSVSALTQNVPLAGPEPKLGVSSLYPANLYNPHTHGYPGAEAGDRIQSGLEDKISGFFGSPQGPGIWPQKPEMFRPKPPMAPPTAPTGDLDSLVPKPPGMVEVPSAYDPAQKVTGHMGITTPEERAELNQTRSAFNTDSVLRGLQQSSPFNQPPPPRISTEELYKQAHRPADQMAPGAGEWAQDELKDRIGPEDFARLLGQKEQETTRMAQANLHPAVQAQQERAARRAAYPAEAQGRSNALSSMFGVQREQVRGQANVEAARARRDQAVQSMLLREIGDMTVGGYQGEPSNERQDRLSRIQMYTELLNRARAGEFNLGDLIGDNELSQYLTDQDVDEFNPGL